MENLNYGFDQRAQIINELLQGLECVKKLQNQITTKKFTTSLSDNNNNYNDDNDNQDFNYSSLIDIMMSTFNKTISIAKQIDNNVKLELPHSLINNIPTSEISHLDTNPRASKRRKMMPKWTKTVEVGPNKTICGLEGPLDDGFSWRKYGQKEILGAKFPRGYYRCTHRHTKGCPAKKQVQQSDSDPSIYQVIYRAEHTCNVGPKLSQAQSKPTPVHQITSKPQPSLSPRPSPQHYSPTPEPIIQEVFMGLGSNGDLQIEVEPNESNNKAQIFRCFSFNTALLETEPIDNYTLSWSADFTSQTTSDSDYFPTSSYDISGITVRTSELDTNDPISGQNSVTNSPTFGDFEFPREQWLDLDPNFF